MGIDELSAVPPDAPLPGLVALAKFESMLLAKPVRRTVITSLFTSSFKPLQTSTSRPPQTHTFGRRVQVFLRAGVIAINTDPPVQRELCDCKRSGSHTWMPCNVCRVTQPDFGDGDFDFAKNKHTMDGIEYSAELVRKESSKSERARVSKMEGVAGAGIPTPSANTSTSTP